MDEPIDLPGVTCTVSENEYAQMAAQKEAIEAKHRALVRLKFAEDLVVMLNEALALDHDAIAKLMDTRVPCARAFIDHPTIQVGWWRKDGTVVKGEPNVETADSELRLGLLGLLNGLIGPRPEDGWGYISAHYDDDGRLTHFQITPKQETRRQA